MAAYPPPSEVDLIFNSKKFVSLPEGSGISNTLGPEIETAQVKADQNLAIINTIGQILYVPESAWIGSFPGNQTYSLQFDLDFNATYLVDFNIGLSSDGFNNGTILYGFRNTFSGAACVWSLGPNITQEAPNYSGNFKILPRAPVGASYPCFMETHIMAVVKTGSLGILYLNLTIFLVDNTGTQVSGTYTIQRGPYANQALKTCKFIRIN
jgi:hypothetical protein